MTAQGGPLQSFHGEVRQIIRETSIPFNLPVSLSIRVPAMRREVLTALQQAAWQRRDRVQLAYTEEAQDGAVTAYPTEIRGGAAAICDLMREWDGILEKEVVANPWTADDIADARTMGIDLTRTYDGPDAGLG